MHPIHFPVDADAEAAFTLIARTKPSLTGSVREAFSMVIGESTRFLWHATATEVASAVLLPGSADGATEGVAVPSGLMV